MPKLPRRSALVSIAAVAVSAQQPPRQQEHPQHKHEGMVNITPPPVYKLRFFTDAEFATLAVLVDLIIPRTDTPGARDARAHEIIDAGVRPREHKPWRDGLAWLNTQANGKPFTALSNMEQTAILTHASRSRQGTPGARFFTLLKNSTVDAYYSTREGLVAELGWRGNTFLPEFKGCTHPEHQG